MDTIPQNQNLEDKLLTLVEELRDLELDLRECETAVEFELLMVALAQIRKALEAPA